MPYIFIISAFMIVMIWLLDCWFDEKRIEKYIRSYGCSLLYMKWMPFSRESFGTRDRTYKVHFIDREGNTHESFCNTSFLGGVYFTKDTIIPYAAPPSDMDHTE